MRNFASFPLPGPEVPGHQPRRLETIDHLETPFPLGSVANIELYQMSLLLLFSLLLLLRLDLYTR